MNVPLVFMKLGIYGPITVFLGWLTFTCVTLNPERPFVCIIVALLPLSVLWFSLSLLRRLEREAGLKIPTARTCLRFIIWFFTFAGFVTFASRNDSNGIKECLIGSIFAFAFVAPIALFIPWYRRNGESRTLLEPKITYFARTTFAGEPPVTGSLSEKVLTDDGHEVSKFLVDLFHSSNPDHDSNAPLVKAELEYWLKEKVFDPTPPTGKVN